VIEEHPSVTDQLDLAKIEERMLQCEQIEIPLTHIFSGGVYIRQIEVPRGAVIIGKRHRFASCNMLLKGKMEFFNEQDKSSEIFEAPYQFTSKPMGKKLALCLEDAIFAEVIPTELTDPEEVERKFIIPEEEYLKLKELNP